MSKPTIQVDGARELRTALRGVADGITDLKTAHADAARIVEQRAGQLVPRLDGNLAATLRSSGQARGGIVRSGRASVPYAGVQHFGWPAHNIRPRPFLYEALDDRRRQVIDVYEDRVNSLIDKYDLA